jgi:hypothetical protein
MVGKYTESQKRAIKKYFDKLKEQGRTRSHGDKEKNRQSMYILRAYKWLPKIFKEPEGWFESEP